MGRSYSIRCSDWSVTVIQEHCGLLTFIHVFNMTDNSSDWFELFVEEALRSLEENGFNFVGFAIKLMRRQQVTIVLTALSLDASEFKLHMF